MAEKFHPILIGVAWCLGWGEGKKPKHSLDILRQMRQALSDGTEVPQEVTYIVDAVRELDNLKFPQTLNELKQLTEEHSILWDSKIGLVYGGATKIKQYVFEESKLPDIRGASGLLDRINLVDLPAFFGKKPSSNPYNYNAQFATIRQWLNNNFSNAQNISDALIPELIIYSTGGNILAYCPAAFVDDIANAIEKRYTEETVTANSCAVGETFRLLETRCGILRDNIDETFWVEKYRQNYKNPLVEAKFGRYDSEQAAVEDFKKRKSFNELTTKLAIRFNQRRSGNDTPNRLSRCYPPMCETHPYLRRDEGEKRSAITQVTQRPREVTYFSESAVRKRRVGDRAKTGESETPKWYKETGLEWEPGIVEGWIDKFEDFLKHNSEQKRKYYKTGEEVKIPQSLTHLSKVSNGYVAYIYADGNNMGRFIQNIATAQAYQEFSEDVENATKYSVYQALANHLHPRIIKGIDDPTSRVQDGDLIHPFEIITIGGDDIILIVPADKALEIAKTIGEQFENILLGEVKIKECKPHTRFPFPEGRAQSTQSEKDLRKSDVKIKGNYQSNEIADLKKCHRYDWQSAKQSRCQLSMSTGVLITAYNTPIYYAEKLATQLLKSAKSRAKKLENKKVAGYQGGTVDFFVMKSVTMISSNIEEFRKQTLVKKVGATLKLYAAPYTLHELDGLLKSIYALKEAKFPKSQLYQIRSFLEQGKHTAILNYRYFRVRLKQGSMALKQEFEEAWCKPKDEKNGGNLAPWMYDFGEIDNPESPEPFYETIWREMVDLYDFELSDVELPQAALEEVNS
jgi:CRISPR-associated protein Cmr2